MNKGYVMNDLSKYQAVILCGGEGTRMRAIAEDKPKPMVEIGGKPILWHIMKIYSFYGIRKFVLCLGYKGEAIVEYFENYHSNNHDFTMTLKNKEEKIFYYQPKVMDEDDVDDWEITFAHTGTKTMTGGRIKRVEKYIKEDTFFCTYGDGLCDVNIKQLFDFHQKHGKTATLTSVKLPTTFGIVEVDDKGLIKSFREKPRMPGVINGGYFVFNKEIFDYIEDDLTVLEDKPFKKLVRDESICSYNYEGFWHCMDHHKDYKTLNDMWETNNASWKIW